MTLNDYATDQIDSLIDAHHMRSWATPMIIRTLKLAFVMGYNKGRMAGLGQSINQLEVICKDWTPIPGMTTGGQSKTEMNNGNERNL